MQVEKINMATFPSDSASLHNTLAETVTNNVVSENLSNYLPLSDNNVSTTNDSLMERNWDIPCETDDINVSHFLLPNIYCHIPRNSSHIG
jgi:hypothetical protein